MAALDAATPQEVGSTLKVELGGKMAQKMKSEANLYNSQHSSVGDLSAGSTRSPASTELASSDSDTASSVSRKVKQAAKLIREKAVLGEPMKVKVNSSGEPSYPNTNHPNIKNILGLQKLQTDLESSLQKLVQQELLEQVWLQQQQMMATAYDPMLPCMGVPGEQMGYPGCSPLVPYLMAELGNGGAMAPPLPGYEYEMGMGMTPEQYPRTHLNPEVKPFKSRDTSNKVNKAASKAAPAPKEDAAQKEKLNEERNADHARTVVATKINRLGFSAEKMLKDHFMQFGKIDHVCVPHKIKRVPGTSAAPGHSHLRPSGLGFIVMESEEEAQAVLAAGAEQLVCGKMINVRAFKQGQNANADEEAAQED
jgi:hypothetical protein